MDHEQRVAAFTAFLRSEGFSPVVDDDGDVRFKFEGRTYYLIGDASDDEYFRLFHVAWTVDPGTEERCRRIAHELTRDLKVVKVFVTGSVVVGSVVAFYQPISGYEPLLLRLLGVCQLAASRFREAMLNDAPAPPMS